MPLARPVLLQSLMSANLLGEACDLLDDRVDLDVVLEAVAGLTVPTVADFCAIDILSPSGTLDRVAIPRNDGPRAERLLHWFPPDPEGDHPIARVLREGIPKLVVDAGLAPGQGVDGRPSGLPIPRSYLVVPLTARGRRVGVLSLVSWNPERRYRNEHLALAARLARQVALAVDNRQLCAGISDVLSVLSHELRTPLAAMLGWITLLRRRDLTAAQIGRGLDVVERNTRLQARLLDDLLELTRLRVDTAVLERRPISLEAVVRDALSSVSGDARTQDIRLHAALDPRSGWMIGDPARLRQLVASVITTVIARIPAGGDVAVALARPTAGAVSLTAGAGPTVVLAEGSGAPEPSSSSSGVPPPDPKGIALMLARRLVELHEGRLRITRRSQRSGFIIQVDLPVREAAPGDGSAASTRAAARHAAAAMLLGRRVLVIEDDGDTQEFLRLSLERSGAVVRVAASGAEALGFLERGPIDVVLSDLTLPEEDGYRVIQAIRARGMTRLPAVALSALSGPGERARSAAAGFAEHLAKPIDPQELAQCLARVVRDAEIA